ncbi:hypothetical protein Cpir12675_002895 [Ceratocystis pirilliformis]|uniref:Small secreted protein n=1 Tax=Ceratocystis pirilliformis TaxID=259994 RepID=A0ABR3Z8U7_9PEZI
MHLSNIIFGIATLSGVAFAVPAPPSTQAAPVPAWTFKDVKRTCSADDTTCTYSFGINTSIDDPVACKYTVNAPSASKANVTDEHCGPFTINSSWNGQFGLESAFTIISVTTSKYIAWPSYSDRELANGNTVQPDRAYQVFIVTEI